MTTTPADDPGPGCEALAPGLLAEPVAAVSSLAFVLAALVIVLATRGRSGYALLVAGVGIGSVIAHGPDPTYADLAHDLPLAATLAFVAADSAATLLRRSRPWWWWVGPTAALVPVILLAPQAADLAQVGFAVLAVGLTVLRAVRDPASRTRIIWSVGLLAVGGVVGTLSRAGGPLCVPESLVQGHAIWHVLASAALVVLAPVLAPQGGITRSPDHDAPEPADDQA
ncbi:ceramidase [Actinotalea sp. C106]|uniref:ceramidase n=1 Tax=Actinotalea sp. C106 TaxID=2908644 RepID=UPI002028DE74|nr:ceramidase [Actinotalea sp. C106]